MNGNAEQMAAEAREVAGRHADILAGDKPLAPPVIVSLPGELTDQPLQVLVRHERTGVRVDVRAESHHAWTPVNMVGGSVEVRPS